MTIWSRASPASRFPRPAFPSASAACSRRCSSRGLTGDEQPLIVVLSMGDAAQSFATARELRAAACAPKPMSAPRKFRDQLKYADKRGAALVVMEGEDERAKGEVTIKDLKLGAEVSKSVESRAEWVGARAARNTVERERAGRGSARAVGAQRLSHARLSHLRPRRHRGAGQAGGRHARRVRRARLYAPRARHPAAGADFRRPFGRGNPQAHLRTHRSVGPRALPAPRSHHSHLQVAGGKRQALIPRGSAITAWRSAIAPGDGPTQFYQAGAELLGLDDRAAGDVGDDGAGGGGACAPRASTIRHEDRRSRPVRHAGRCARRSGAMARAA